MANWQSNVDLKDLFDKYDSNNITLPALVQEVINRFKQNQFYPLFQHHVIALQESLDGLAQPYSDSSLDYLEVRFDSFMDLMYDFGDRQYRIWIKTTF